MDSYWTVQRKTAVPLPNPMLLVPSEAPAREVSNPVRTKFTAKKFLLLIGVFIFVSLMIGILLWILQYEIQKTNRNTSEFIKIPKVSYLPAGRQV